MDFGGAGAEDAGEGGKDDDGGDDTGDEVGDALGEVDALEAEKMRQDKARSTAGSG